jgi:hypothetical protein
MYLKYAIHQCMRFRQRGNLLCIHVLWSEICLWIYDDNNTDVKDCDYNIEQWYGNITTWQVIITRIDKVLNFKNTRVLILYNIK